MDLWFYPDDELEKTEKISCQVKQILEDKRREEQQQCILDHQFVLDSRPSSLPRFSPRSSHPHTPISPHSSVSNTPTTELNYDENGAGFDEDYDPAYITNASLSNNGSFTATTNPILHNASNVPATIRRSTSNYSISSNISASTTTTRRSTKSKSKKNINCELDNARREVQNFENRIKDRTNWDETAVASHEQIKQAMHLLSSSDSHDLKLIYSIVQVLVDRINEKDDRNKQLDQLVHKMLSNNRYLIQQNQHLIWQQQQHYQQQQMQQQQLREKIRGMNRTRSSSTSFHDDSVHANDTFLSSSQSNNNNNNNFMSNNCNNNNNMNNSMQNTNMHNNNHNNNHIHRGNNDECSPYSPCSSPLPLSPFQFADYDGSSNDRITSQDKVFQTGNPPYANDDHYYPHYYYNDANDDDIYDSEQVNYGRARAEGSVQEFDTDNYFAEDFMDEYPTGFDEKLDGDDDEKHNDEQQDKENGSSNHALFELDFSSAVVEDLEYLKRYYGEYNNNHQHDDCCSNDGSDDGSNEVPIGSYEAILHRIESVYDDYIRNQKRRKHSKQGKRRHK